VGYSFQKALLPKEKRIIPTPSITRVFGHGKGHPNKGLGMPVAISMASMIRSIPAMMRRIFEAFNIFHLHSLVLYFYDSRGNGACKLLLFHIEYFNTHHIEWLLSDWAVHDYMQDKATGNARVCKNVKPLLGPTIITRVSQAHMIVIYGSRSLSKKSLITGLCRLHFLFA